jgi:hypothetical protein
VQLRLKRGQSSKMFGGVKFELTATATLTSEESSLINKYKVQDEVLTERQIKIPLTDRALIIKITIGSLVSGQTFKCNDISEVLHYEEEIKASCSKLRQLIEVMKTFGGEEVIEFTADGAKVLSVSAG